MTPTIRSVAALPASRDTGRDTMSYFFLRIEADDGTVGYGEGCDSYGCSYPRVLQAIVADAYAPFVVGQPVGPPHALVERLRSSTRRRLGDAWTAVQARSAVEIALWDLYGKVTGRSVRELLGSDRDRVPVYAAGAFLEEGDAAWHVDRLAPALARGVTTVKLRIGPHWREDLATLEGVRRMLGDDVEIAVDGSETFTLPTARRICRRLAELDIAWFEEPLPQSAGAGIAELVTGSAVPIAYGEHIFGRQGALSALDRRELSILQPDAATCGGIEEARQMALSASYHGVRVMPHNCAGPIALAANATVAATTPGIRLLEYGINNVAPWTTLSGGAPVGLDAITDGELELPPGPGLGVDLDEEVVRAHPYLPPGRRVAGTAAGLPDRFVGDR